MGGSAVRQRQCRLGRRAALGNQYLAALHNLAFFIKISVKNFLFDEQNDYFSHKILHNPKKCCKFAANLWAYRYTGIP